MAKDRQSVPTDRKWRLEDIFETQADWEALFAEVETKMDFSEYEGKLNTVEIVYECLEKLNAVMLDINKLAVYAFMRRDEDTRNSEAAALLSRMNTLEMKLAGNTAYMTPELSALPVETLEAFARDARLKDYDYTLRLIIDKKPHILSKEIEELLSQESKIFGGYQQVFSMLDNADFPAPTITVGGQKIHLTHRSESVV